MRYYTGKKSFKEFFQFLENNDMGHLFKMVTKKEIDGFIDCFYPKTLPLSYIEFMSYTGNGHFWVGSDYEINKVSSLKKDAEYLLYIENDFQQKLQEDDFVFWMHQGYMFYFFNLNEGDNPPVYYYNENEQMDRFVKCSNNFIDFIINPWITGIPNPL